MKNKVLDSILNFLKKQSDYSESDLIKIRYGLEGIYLTITKLLVIFMAALLLEIFKEVIICLLLFNLIRYFSFGFHAEKSYECLILSLLNFIAIPYLFLNFNRALVLDIIIGFVCLLILLIYAPADTVKRPLRDIKKRLFRKFSTLLIAIIYFVLLIMFNNNYLSDLLLSVLVVDAIIVNPITYLIFRQPYNNYKN